ncbi:MAG: hypothetical protein JJE04_23200 [Acidobacteriia bacterium]|nr:hypothetical protein [Terriglobia bacterium]
MSSRRFSGLAALALAATCLYAQQASLDGPVSGLVYDGQSKALRIIMGVPGAAFLGGELAGSLELASVSPDGRFALALSEGKLNLIRLDQPDAVWQLLDEHARVERIAWSQDSSAAAVAGDSRVTLWRNLATQASRLDLDLPAEIGSLTALAVHPEANSVAIATKGSVFYLDGQSKLVAQTSDASALLFDGADLFLADRSTDQILRIRGYASSAELSLLAGAAMRIDDPVAINLAPGGASLMVAGGSSRSLLWIDRSTGEVSRSLDLDFEPVRLDRFSGVSPLFVLNDRASATDPVQILDGGAIPAVYFVPAGQASSVED